MRRLFLVIIVLLSCAPALAQNYWRAADGPYGGTIVSGMTVAPDGFYAATVGGLFKSLDGGLSWQLDTEGITASGVDARKLIRTADGSQLLATYGGGVFRRWPGATEWERTQSPDAWIQSLTEADDGTIYAATIRGLLRSENGGSTWQALSVSGRSLNIRDVVTQPGLVYAATSEGVYKSEDGGLTWDWASAGMTTFDVDLLFVSSTGDLYAGTSPIDGGCTLFRTRSAGRLWTCVQPQTDPIRAGGMAEDEQGRLYFGGYRFVYRSDDEGSSWTVVATTNTTVHGIAASGSTVVAGTYGRGVIRSGSRGTNWEKANQGLQSAIRDIAIGPDGDLYAATLGGVYASSDLGASWDLLDDTAAPVRPAQSLAFDAQGRLLDGTLNGLFRLDRTTGVWDALGPPGTPPVLDIIPAEDGELYVGYHEGVYHLRGQNWTSYPLIGPDQAARSVIAVGRDEAGTIFAGGTYDSFMRPAGSTGWIRLTSAATPYFEAQVFAKGTDDRLYAGTRYFGVMRSGDGGQTWSPMTAGLSGSEDIRTIAFDAAGVMHIGSFGNGVYRYNDRTRAWQSLDSGMERARRVTALAFDGGGNAFAGTYGSGIWVHEAGSTTTEPGEEPTVLRFDLYPNPTAAGTALVIEGRTAGVSVYDLIGRRVFEAASTSGEVTLPSESWTPGLYLVRVETGERVLTRTLVVTR